MAYFRSPVRLVALLFSVSSISLLRRLAITPRTPRARTRASGRCLSKFSVSLDLSHAAHHCVPLAWAFGSLVSSVARSFSQSVQQRRIVHVTTFSFLIFIPASDIDRGVVNCYEAQSLAKHPCPGRLWGLLVALSCTSVGSGLRLATCLVFEILFKEKLLLLLNNDMLNLPFHTFRYIYVTLD